jgi:sugar phosphate isomerase/epimerase
MTLRDRIGIDVGRRLRLEDAIEWAAMHDVRYVDIQLDTAANALNTFDDARTAGIREACKRRGIHLGLHTLSAVNVAEYSPYVAEAVDHYLNGYVDVYGKLGAEWIVVHAGYHFTSDKEMRMTAGLERLKRVVDYAEKKNALILLENLNKEPTNAEVHYLAHTIEEWRFYFERSVARVQAVVYGKPRASRSGRDRRVCRRARYEPRSGGAARRLLPQRP